MDAARTLLWTALGALACVGQVANAQAQVTREAVEASPGPGVSPRSDVAANDRVLALMQSAQDELAMATDPQWRERWGGVNRLLSDIDVEMARSAAPTGPLVSRNAASPGPPAPVRDESHHANEH